MRARPTPSAGSRHQLEGGGGIGEVQHDLRARSAGMSSRLDVLDLEVADALVDEARSPSAQDTVIDCPSCSTLGRVAGADHRGQAQFAADDGGVARCGRRGR